MKKSTAIILSAFLLITSFSLAACGSADLSAPAHFSLGAGFLRSFAVDESGSAYYWGIDLGSEDSLGTEDLSTVPEHLVTFPEAAASDVSSVFVSDCAALFLKNDRSLWLLATPALTGDFCAPEAAKLMDNVISADVSSTDILAVDESGTLWSFKSSLTAPEKLLDNIAYVSAGSGTWLAVGSDGKLWQRGSDSYILDDVVMAVAGSRTSAAVKKDGSLWVWGEYGGETPTRVSKNVIYAEACEVSQYRSAILYITADNALWGLGYDSRSGNTFTEAEKLLDNVSFVSAYSSVVLAAKTDGTVEGWGSNAMGSLCSADLTLTAPQSIPLSGIISPR